MHNQPKNRKHCPTSHYYNRHQQLIYERFMLMLWTPMRCYIERRNFPVNWLYWLLISGQWLPATNWHRHARSEWMLFCFLSLANGCQGVTTVILVFEIWDSVQKWRHMKDVIDINDILFLPVENPYCFWNVAEFTAITIAYGNKCFSD